MRWQNLICEKKNKIDDVLIPGWCLFLFDIEQNIIYMNLIRLKTKILTETCLQGILKLKNNALILL